MRRLVNGLKFWTDGLGTDAYTYGLTGSHSSEWPTWLKIGAAVLGGSILLPAITRYAYFGGIPPLPRSIFSTQFTPAQLIPMAWNKGYIRNWGAFAGLIR